MIGPFLSLDPCPSSPAHGGFCLCLSSTCDLRRAWRITMLAARLLCLRTLPPRAFRPGLSTKAAPVLKGPIRKDPWPLAPSRVKITWMPLGLALCSPASSLLHH